MYIPKVEIIGCVFVSFLLLSPADARHKHVTCVGDRQEGDKWFDGCKWCVCQRSGPLCSPAQCSDLTGRVPPCTRLGSRWHDGCYNCKCREYGIECQADRACVLLMEAESYKRHVMTIGACVQPKDDRCVCGVDGVPSCTAEVIDRDAHPATTIAFDLSLPYATKETVSGTARNAYQGDMESNRQQQSYPYRNVDEDDADWKQNRLHHRHAKPMEASDKRGQTLVTVVQNDDWVAAPRRRSFSDPPEDSLKPYREYKRHEYAYPQINSRDVYESNPRPRESRLTSQRLRMRMHRATVRAHIARKTSRDYFRHAHRYRRSAEREWRLASVRNSAGQFVNVPGSLLVITDNRCRYGIRWYGGGLRCFCDEQGSVTCGDPSFVASRIDGFRLEKLPCEEGHAWEENGSCQVCQCKISGVVLCRRSESCPLPFLIRPVTYGDEYYGSSEESTDNEQDVDTTEFTKRKPTHTSIDVNLEDKVRAQDPDESLVQLNRNPGQKLPLPHEEDKPRSYHTTVIVHECKPGSRWMDGCKRCFCDKGRKMCDERRCLKPRLLPDNFPSNAHSVKDKISGRPMQRPPSVPVVRNGPISIKPKFFKTTLCGRYKERQVYWVKCNLCICTSGGPRCTAKSCG